MGMQQKLDKARQEGFTELKCIGISDTELRGQYKGATETWDLMEQMFIQIDGIGSKTREKILWKIKQYANNEKARLERST